jgi:hypothetical protein
MAHTARSRAVTMTYRVRVSTLGAVVVTKQMARGEKQSYWVHGDGIGQRCTCPDFGYRGTICKHIRLVNLLLRGALSEHQSYRWDGTNWVEAGMLRTSTASTTN